MAQTIPKIVTNKARSLGYDGASFYGRIDNTTYYVCEKKETQYPPFPTGYPIFIALKNEKMEIIDGRLVFELFRH